VRAIGLDPALGGQCGFTCAELGEQFVILDAAAPGGYSKVEQIFTQLELMAAAYRPSLVIVEFDAQQKGIGNDDRLAEMGRRLGFSVRPHITRGQKMDPVFGVASMDQSFKAGDIRIPYGDQTTKDRMAPLIEQFRAWRPDVPTKNLTQDLVMSTWFIWRHWMEIRKKHREPPVPAWRPSWLISA
jgi:hypothetical protein